MAASATRVWTEKFASMSHGRTRYWEAGTGDPTILLHGAGWNSGCESWAVTIGPLAERLRVPGMHPGRAPTIVTGTVILVQVMRAFGLQEVEVSELDILHGSALSAAMAPA